MTRDNPRIANVIKLYDGNTVDFSSINMTSYLDRSLNTALRYLKPIVELIGHPILTTVNERSGAQSIYFVYNETDTTKATAQMIDQRTWIGRMLPEDHKPVFDDNIEYYRQFEITAHDAWNLLQKLLAEQESHIETKKVISDFFEAERSLERHKGNLYAYRFMPPLGQNCEE